MTQEQISAFFADYFSSPCVVGKPKEYRRLWRKAGLYTEHSEDCHLHHMCHTRDCINLNHIVPLTIVEHAKVHGNWEKFILSQTPEERSQRTTEFFSDPANREAMSQAMREYWSDEANREAHSQWMTEYWSDETNRVEQSQRTTEFYSDPANREAQSERMADVWSDEALREAQSERTTAYWSDEANRAAQSVAQKKRRQLERLIESSRKILEEGDAWPDHLPFPYLLRF